MVSVDFTFGGDDLHDLARHLLQIEDRVGDELESALEDIAIRVEADAARMAPVDTGRLRASITHSVEQIGRNAFVAYIGSNVEYAPIQEIEQPYLRPAFEQNRGFITDRLQTAMENAVEG